MNVIEMSIKMEQEAVDFYTKCAEKTDNPIGKKMFLSIAEDEKHHIACAIHVKQKKEFSPAKTRPMQDMKKIFEQNKESMLKRVSSTTDELQALQMAMRMEEDAIKFYRNAAAQTTDPAENAFFTCLIQDEEEHFAIFQNTHSFLSDSGNWFMWDEQGIVEG
jgi:rubrerythrin